MRKSECYSECRSGSSKANRRAFAVEFLESRRLLTIASWWNPAGMTPDAWAAQIASQYEGGQIAPATEDVQLSSFASEEAVQAALEDLVGDYWGELFGEAVDLSLQQQYEANPWPWPWAGGGDTFWLEADDAIGVPPILGSVMFATALEANSTDRTNVQVKGVDEADTAEISADGYLYASRQNRIYIFDISDPTKLVQVSSLDADWGTQLFLDGQRLIAVDNNEVRLFDVSRKSMPQLMSTLHFQDSIHASRFTDGRLILTTTSSVDVPRPQLILAEGVSENQHVQLTDQALGRFETREEFLSRVSAQLVADFLPNVLPSDPGGVWQRDIWQREPSSDHTQVGDWQDIAFAAGSVREQVTAVVIDTSDNSLAILDSETLLGVTPQFVYFEDASLYVVDNRDWRAPLENQHSDVFKFALAPSSGEIALELAGRVEGVIADSRSLSAHNGDLRIATDTTLPGDDAVRHSANIFVLRDEVVGDGRYEVIGRLEDIADGEALFAAYFDGERAVVTTAEMRGLIPLFDPLHGIDLSDPTDPREVSELVIPGVTTRLQWVGESHLAGIGFVEQTPGNWASQVSLYDVSDLANPSVTEVWEGDATSPFFPRFLQNMLAVHFDAASGTLILPQNELGELGKGARVFRIDPNADVPLNDLGVIAASEVVTRGYVAGEAIFALGWEGIVTASVDDPSQQLTHYLFDMGARDDYLPAESGREVELHVLQNDQFRGVARITDVSPTALGASLRISELGDSIIYEASEQTTGSDWFTYSAVDEKGETSSASVVVSLVGAGSSRVVANESSDETVQFLIKATNESGDLISEAHVGDRIWIELSADRESGVDAGVYQAVFEVEWDPRVLQLAGEPEPMGVFQNGLKNVPSATGFKELGGFSNSTDRLGEGPHAVVRFMVDVISGGALEITARPSRQPTSEVLLYDESAAVHPDNVSEAVLKMEASDLPRRDPTDVNQDGLTSALDVLMIVNFLNDDSVVSRLVVGAEGESTAEMVRLDVNRDGLVSALDALTIVNFLNRPPTRQPDGEALDAADAAASLRLQVRASDGPVDTLDSLAAAYSSVWEMDRKK